MAHRNAARDIAAAWIVAIGFASVCSGQALTPTPVVNGIAAPDPFHYYVEHLFGASAIAKAAALSLLDERQGPTAASRNTDYLGQIGKHLAEAAITETAQDVIGAGLHQDPSFKPCECDALAGRVRHALLGPFTARNRSGQTVFSVAHIAGLLAGQLATGAVDRRLDVTRKVVVGVAGLAGVDLVRELLARRRRSNTAAPAHASVVR